MPTAKKFTTRESQAATIQKLIAALQEVNNWNDHDLKVIEDISPDENILRARRKFIRAAIKQAAQ